MKSSLFALFFFASTLALRAVGPAAGPTSEQLRAALVDSDHIDITWSSTSRLPGGVFLEFRLNAESDFSLLAMIWSGTMTFRHLDVARDTRFTYRVRPFFGAPSSAVAITTGAPPSRRIFNGEADGPLPDTPGTRARPDAPVVALRDPKTFQAAAPSHLTGTQPSPTTADLRWSDAASDEEGFLVEMALSGSDDWQICALLPADTRSFRKTNLPPHTALQFRVRAFFHGAPSALASVDTPRELRRVATAVPTIRP